MELERRRRARQHLIDFARYTERSYRPAQHHHLIAEKLEAVANGEIQRLMIFMPPRHGKSELASRRFPAWFLGNNPDRSIIAASYGSDLAGDFGRDVRNIVADAAYQKLFDTKLAEDSKAAGRWHTQKKGGYVAAGVGTAITGRGAHILLIDDPIKDRESADSETLRDKAYKWYLSTAYTRLEGSITEEDEDELWRDPINTITSGDVQPFDGAVVIIQTRWHEDDLAGRLLRDAEEGADQFEVLSLPAIDSEGQALWPAKYPLERLESIKKTLTRVSDREWESLYQQNPTPDEGTFFKRDWFKRFHLSDQPDTRKYITTDYAVSEGKGDFTEFGVWGVDSGDNLYALDWYYDQSTSDVWVERMLDLVHEHKPLTTYGEKGVIQRAIEPLLNKRSQERKVYGHFDWVARTKDKAAMAQSFRARAASGKVYIPFGDWGDRLINQLCAFPAGKHDDGVDVCALIGLVLDEIVGQGAPESKSEDRPDRWDRAFTDDDDDSGFI